MSVACHRIPIFHTRVFTPPGPCLSRAYTNIHNATMGIWNCRVNPSARRYEQRGSQPGRFFRRPNWEPRRSLDE